MSSDVGKAATMESITSETTIGKTDLRFGNCIVCSFFLLQSVDKGQKKVQLLFQFNSIQFNSNLIQFNCICPFQEIYFIRMHAYKEYIGTYK